MAADQEKINELKKLVQKSTFFSKNEKKQILEQMSQMSSNEINNAITILEEEQKKLEQMRKTGDENLKLMEKFVDRSGKEIETMARNIAHKIEADEEKKDSEEAEKLLDLID